MPEYRRLWVPGATYFLTITTFRRRPILASPGAVQHWRVALAESKKACGFDVIAGVVLPDHLHLIIKLPTTSADVSKPIGIAKAAFTRASGGPSLSSVPSRKKHREGDVWQRRFFDHAIRDDDDYAAHFDYLHFNPVKHGHVDCPADWPHSSFDYWVRHKVYEANWCCSNWKGKWPNFDAIVDTVGE